MKESRTIWTSEDGGVEVSTTRTWDVGASPDVVVMDTEGAVYFTIPEALEMAAAIQKELGGEEP